eukprot:1532303-Pyramimonas_sp.AAC.1
MSELSYGRVDCAGGCRRLRCILYPDDSRQALAVLFGALEALGEAPACPGGGPVDPAANPRAMQ